jgi:DNA-binding IscR family transcriptional regulator
MVPKHSAGQGSAPWTYLTNHAHVLILVARDASSTMRAVAEAVGITERAVQRIVGELEEAGVLKRTRKGRRNVYAINAALTLRHPLESHCTVADLLALVNAPPGKSPNNAGR